ncbi:MAG: beta-galactosidase [Eubacteriales bacterium]
MREQNFKWDKISLGVCYYPEHWDESLWQSDLTRMKEVGIDTIRIAEFAWNLIEIEEDVFCYDFFDKFLDVAYESQMKVIFGTPTATPPAWMANKYPEICNSTIDGIPYRHGARRHYTYNSVAYQKFCKRIVENIAKHYGNHKAIVGWQIDNELNCETDEFYAESDTLAFRSFLKKKYKEIGVLNEAWGTQFWNQSYLHFDEIYVPRTTLHNSTNPHQVLDYKRFISDSVLGFCKMQSDIIKQYVPSHVFVTTNGLFGNIDNHTMTDICLDVYTYDSYPNFAYALEENPAKNRRLNDRKWSSNLTQVRSICNHFGIMEQQSGANGWNTRLEAIAPKPGQVMLWTMQSIAHGADFVSYFRWRTSTMGTEIYWHGILDYDNCDNRKLREIAQVHKRVKKIEHLANASYEAKIAIVKDYSNEWDSEVDVWHERFDKESLNEIFVAAQVSHTPCDYLYLLEHTTVEELLKYTVLIYPHGLIQTQNTVDLLEAYVKQGGTLILGCRTGQKDESGRCPMMKLPGLLAPIAGISVKESTFVAPYEEMVVSDWNGTKMEMPIYNDVLQVEQEDVEVLSVYENTYYEKEVSFTKRKVGNGQVFYLGTTFSRNNITMILKYLDMITPHKNMIELPPECELVIRKKNGIMYVIVLNYEREKVKIVLKEIMKDLDTGRNMVGTVILNPYETKVYEVSRL